MNFQSLFSLLQAGTPFQRDLGKKFRILDLTIATMEKNNFPRVGALFS